MTTSSAGESKKVLQVNRKKEKEKQMFPEIRKTKLDLDALGRTLFETKQQLENL